MLAPPLGATPGREVLAVLPGATAQPDMGVAQWAFDQAQPAGRGTDTLPASRCLYLPLKAPMRTRGVLAIEPAMRALAAGAGAAAACSTPAPRCSRSRWSACTTSTWRSDALVQMESERLRNSLLAAISHDLRTPLTALVGLADRSR